MINSSNYVIVSGAGPAGLAAAIAAASNGHKVLILEHLPSAGRKLLASGAGKCNLTNILNPNDMAERFAPYTSSSVIMSNACRLSLDASLGAEALLVSSSDSVVTSGGLVVDGEGSYAAAAYSEREEEGGARSRVFVVSSVLLTNADVLIANGYSNKEFIYSLLEVAFDGDVGIYGTHRIVFDTTIVEGLTQKMAGVYTAILLTIPAVLAVLGTVVCIRRKNK